MITKHESTTIDCIIMNQPAALERVIRVIRVRGFSIESMQVSKEFNELKASFLLSGERSITNLIHQLEKLVDVKTAMTHSDLMEADHVVYA